MRSATQLLKQTLLAALLAMPILSSAQAPLIQQVNPDSKNSLSQQQKPYVILISADGFRYDYAKKYNAEHLLALSSTGAQAKSMIPSYPSLTFPNHYTLVTGLYPAHHGLVNNSFYDEKRQDKYSLSDKAKVTDGSWYGGTPLWVLAEKQQMIAASLFWVGSEAAVQGVRPTYYYNYTEQITPGQRVQIVKDWLELPEDRRPHLITLYLSEPDHAGHTYGPDTKQTEAAVKMVDSTVYMLTEMVKSTGLPVNFIFVSDHGMTAVDTSKPIAIPAAVDPKKYIVASSGTLVDIHAKNKADVEPLYQELKRTAVDYKVFLKSDMPKKYHYRDTDDRLNHIGDVLLIPKWPHVFSNRTPNIGNHGFDPRKVKEMQATFFAWGPAFKANQKIGSFENVNVYPLVSEILGLPITAPIDGKISVLGKLLK